MAIFQLLSRILLSKTRSTQHSSNASTTHNPKPTLKHILSEFANCTDLTHRSFPDLQVELVYFANLVGKEEFARDVIVPLDHTNRDQVSSLLAQSQFVHETESKHVVNGILNGCVALFHKGKVYLVSVSEAVSRNVEDSQTETNIVGPHDSFVESSEKNLALLRKRVKSSHLKTISLKVGEITKTNVYILYIDGIANMDYVRELVRRIKMIEVDAVYDSNMLVQYIDDSPRSIFPLFMTSERTDAAASKLVGGRIVCIVDGSPSVFSAPSTFFDFFSSSDDYYHRWPLATGTRILRLIALVVTLTFTSLYVAVTTYHYEMIPETLLITLTESRSRVPFPPVYEALLMETTIELLREAGARLPTKIGQTIGIVGGIVIGQAAVQAGLTSNILIIAVASSAIASFVIPSYVMSASIRLIRFGLIILAGLWGNFGLMVGFALIVTHLAGLTSLGASYLVPVAPMKFKDWLDVFIRAPFKMLKDRPSVTQTPNPSRNKMKK